MSLVNKSLLSHTQVIHYEKRFCIIKVFNYILINVYLPCAGLANRQTLCDDLLADIWSWRIRYHDCECLIAADLNTDLDSSDAVALSLTRFINDCSLVRCDDLFPSQKVDTYVNFSLNQRSRIDYTCFLRP